MFSSAMSTNLKRIYILLQLQFLYNLNFKKIEKETDWSVLHELS